MAGQTPHHDDHGPPEGHGPPENHEPPEVRRASDSHPETEAARTPGAGTWDLDHLVLDEEFIREADATEPSARARMLAARWRRERPEPQPWRSDEPPVGWFFSKSRRRRRRRG